METTSHCLWIKILKNEMAEQSKNDVTGWHGSVTKNVWFLRLEQNIWSFWQFLTVYWVFGQILNLLWQFYNDIGNFFHLPNTEKYSSHLVTLQKGEAENTNILVLIILLYTVQRTLTWGLQFWVFFILRCKATLFKLVYTENSHGEESIL